MINPAAVVLSAVMMLRHFGEFGAPAKIEHAILVTLEKGKVHTGDVVGYDSGASTSAFTDTVIAKLGRTAERHQLRAYEPIRLPEIDRSPKFVRPRTGA